MRVFSRALYRRERLHFASLRGGEGVFATIAGIKETNNVAKERQDWVGKRDGIRGARLERARAKKAH